MAEADPFVLGEFPRTLDERYRLSIPPELAEPLSKDGNTCALVKERPGCLSLWNASGWKRQLDEGVELVERKMRAGRLAGRIHEVQQLGRLLSTRHRMVPLAGRGRLVVPEGFREFLGVEPGSEVMVIGAAVCVELWHPGRWIEYLDADIPEFRALLDQLSN